MNTFFPFFPFFPALISLRSALIVIINALLGIECADRYKLHLLCFGGCKHILGTTLLQF